MRCVLLNSLPINIFGSSEVIIKIKPITYQELANLVQQADEVKCYIRHPATVQLLNSMLKVWDIELQPSSGLYSFNPEDTIIVVTLARPLRGQEVTEVTPEMLILRRIEVLEYKPEV